MASSDFRESEENWTPPDVEDDVPCLNADMDVDFNNLVAVVILS